MRGRIPKPLAVKVVEGQPIRRDRVNTEAPEPPRGPLDAPVDLTAEERGVWEQVIKNHAPGALRPLDIGALRRYAWSYAALLQAQEGLRQWREAKKKPGETDILRRARNGALVVHQLYGLIKDLQAQVSQIESVLGLTPVARERIHAGLQGELFNNPDDPWATFDKDFPIQKAN
jgi:P27 family predicted phage terminase small subunit